MKTVKRIPNFRSEAEEAKFWETHSAANYLHELKEVRNVKFSRPRKRLISVRMDDVQINSLKEVAATKGVGYLTLIRMWVMEKLYRELKLHHAHRS